MKSKTKKQKPKVEPINPINYSHRIKLMDQLLMDIAMMKKQKR
jgi:hypothetical protein